MNNSTFAERVAAACKREIKMNESNDRTSIAERIYPNDLNDFDRTILDERFLKLQYHETFLHYLD